MQNRNLRYAPKTIKYNVPMRHAITAEEQKILAKNCHMLQSRMNGAETRLTFPILVAAFVFAGAFSAFTSFGLMGEKHPMAGMVFFILCVVLSVAICAVWLVIERKIFSSKMFRTGITNINGGTIFYNEELSCVEYIEDDFTDEHRKPYLIRIPEHKDPYKPGERVIVVINGDSVYLMKLNEQLASLLPGLDGWQASSDSKHIGHQMELKFHDYSVSDGEAHIQRFFKTYKNGSKYPKAYIYLEAAFFGFLGAVFIVFSAYGFIFRFIPPADDIFFPIALPFIPVLTVATTIAAGQIYKHRLMKHFGDFHGVTRVILTGAPYSVVNSDTKTFNVVEMDLSGKTVTKMYTVKAGFDVLDVKHMKPGQIIYKYTFGQNGIFFGTK